MKLAADSMLGRLTRWLRLSGYDVKYLSDAADDEEILELAAMDERVLLTRDEGLYRRAKGRGIQALLIESGDIVKQLRQVIAALGVHLRDKPLFSRCPVCNGLLNIAKKEEVRGAVPKNVPEGDKELWRCTGCGKIYWEGRHWENIKKMIEEVRSDV